MERNALSRRQFRQTGFDESQYIFNQQCGVFVATIDCKRWGKRKKLITYMTFADGRKIVTPTWPRSRYEGLANMEVGCRIRVTYDKTEREPCASAESNGSRIILSRRCCVPS